MSDVSKSSAKSLAGKETLIGNCFVLINSAADECWTVGVQSRPSLSSNMCLSSSKPGGRNCCWVAVIGNEMN